MEQISPTRMNLLARKNQVKFARQGADLLARKKDALLNEFLKMLGPMFQARAELEKLFAKEYEHLIMAEAVHGTSVMSSLAAATAENFSFSLNKSNMWGVKVWEIEHNYRLRDVFSRHYSSRGVSPSADGVAGGFEKIVALILKVVPQEIRLRKMGEEIKKTNRRINALETHLIPKLQVQVKHISRVLDERARDDTFRLKKIKRKKESKGTV